MGGCVVQTWIPYNAQASGRRMPSVVKASEKGTYLAGCFSFIGLQSMMQMINVV